MPRPKQHAPSRRLPAALTRLGQGLGFLFCSLRDFAFPPICLGCAERDVETGLVCPRCLERLRLASGMPAPSLCCQTIHVRALGPYAQPFSSLVHELKYRNRKSLTAVLGGPMARLLRSDAVLARANCLVPIPLHPARLRERGYNQSELLAQYVARETQVPVLPALRRVRNTKDQINLTTRQRRANLRGAFALNPDCSLAGQRVVLIDDVVTTGATLESAAQVLGQAQATEVSALVVAQIRTPAR
ncbi:MAG: ComF family protein [candidate division WOR-3 bacterium]